MVTVKSINRNTAFALTSVTTWVGSLNFEDTVPNWVGLESADQLDESTQISSVYSFPVSDMNHVGRSVRMGQFQINSIAHSKCDGSLTYIAGDSRYHEYVLKSWPSDTSWQRVALGSVNRRSCRLGDVDNIYFHNSRMFENVFIDGGYVDIVLHVVTQCAMTYFGESQGLYAKVYSDHSMWCTVFRSHASGRDAESTVPYPYSYQYRERPKGTVLKHYSGSFSDFIASEQLYIQSWLSAQTWPYFKWDVVSDSRPDVFRFSPYDSMRPQSFYENQIRACCLGRTPEELVMETARAPWPELAYSAYDSLNDQDGFAGNGVSFLKEIPEQLSTIQSLNESLKGVYTAIPKGKTISDIVKAGSSLYLAIHYGIKLTLLDSQELVESYEGFANDGFVHRRLGASRTVESADGGKSIYTFTQYYTPHNSPWSAWATELKNFKEFMHQYDVEISLENTWDLLPWTFVVDWFTNFGDSLSHIDKEIRLFGTGSIYDPYDLTAHIRSVKTILPLRDKLPLDTYNNTLTSITYTRICGEGGERLTLPPSNPITPQRHWLEGSTLVLQQVL